MKKNSARILLVLVAVLVACGTQAQAQTTQESTEILQLREEVKRREALDRDAPDELRDSNRRVLAERRGRLRDLLQAKVAKLRASEETLGDKILPEEKQLIDERVRVYELEIRVLNTDLQAAQNPPRAAPDNPAPAPDVSAEQQPTPAVAENDRAAENAERVEPISESAETEDDGETPTEQRSCAEFKELESKNVFAVSPLDKTICSVIDDIKERKNGGEVNSGVQLVDEFDELVTIIIGRKDTPTFLTEAEEASTDEQVDAGPSNSGTTSLVTKGGTPTVLGFAVANGALTETVTGTTVTFRGNPLGVIRTFSGLGLVTGLREDEKDPLTRFLRKTSFSFSFDTDRGPEPGVFTANKQQFSSVGARVEFVNNRKPNIYAAKWEQFVATKGVELTAEFGRTRDALLDTTGLPFKWDDPALQAWFVQTQEELKAASSAQVEAVFRDRLSKLPIAELSPQTVATLNGYAQMLGAYVAGRDEFLDEVSKGTLITFDYLNKREVSKPDTSTFTFIAEKGPGGRYDLTFNGALTLLHSRPMLAGGGRAGRVRDFQFAGQIDVPFGNPRDIGQFAFWAAGRYERLMEDASDAMGGVVPNTKGDIGVLQLGLKIPIKGLGIRFPISVSFANRTELIKEREVRGNFGFTFSLDQILARLMPF